MWLEILFIFMISLTSPNDWYKYTHPEGDFEILLHGEEPIIKTDLYETEIGYLEYITFHVNSKFQDSLEMAFVISYCDYPHNSVHSDSTELVEALFETTLEGALLEMNGKLIYSDDILMFSYPGMIWRIDYLQGEAILKNKVFFVENRFYTIQVAGVNHPHVRDAMEKYLESFILKK
jgi:hypothetical protein